MSQHDIRSAERPEPDQVLIDIAQEPGTTNRNYGPNEGDTSTKPMLETCTSKTSPRRSHASRSAVSG